MTLTELTARRISEPLPPLSLVRPDLPTAVGQVIQRATSLNPSDRYEDVAMMLATFQAAVEALIVSSRASKISAAMSRTQQLAALTLDLPNPYKGLRTFQESDAANFFGRQALIDRLVGRMREPGAFNRFLAVVGPSGSGKSSAVKAGLIPALRTGAITHSSRWYYVELTPGAQPFKELEAALTSIAVQPPENLDEQLMRDPRELLNMVQQLLPSDQTTELFLLIDQFEELFTQVTDAERDRFLESLHIAVSSPASRIRVVVTLRADFYDRPLLLPLISEMMRVRNEVIVPLTPAELEDAIVEPGRRLGVELEPGLNTAIVREVTDHPGALPLLQYLMSELFQRRQGMWMTLAAYQEMGGVRGALAKRAEEIYEGLPAPQRAAMQQLLLRLITLGEGTEDTRRRTLIAEVNGLGSDPAVMRTVIDTLGKARLLTFDRDPETRSPTVEVTHEAIIREWQRLRVWLDASRNDVRFQRNLAALTNEWLNANRDSSYLLRDARLRQFETWSQESTVALTPNEAAYLSASLQEQAKRQTIELQRAENERKLERRARSRLSILVTVMALALLVGVILTGYALTATQRAQVESEISQSLAQAASAGRALTEGDADLAVVLALEANSGANAAPQALRTLTEVVFSPGTRGLITGHTSAVTSVAMDPLRRYVASGSRDSIVRVWSLDDQSLVYELVGHRGDVQTVAFSPDGRYLASSGLDFAVLLWNMETGEQVRQFSGHSAAVRSLVFSPDGATLVTASRDTQVIVWDVELGAAVRTLSGHTATAQTVAFSPDGAMIASGAGDGEIILWNAVTGERLINWTSSINGVNDLDFTADGMRLVSALGDSTVAIWATENGALERTIGVDDVPLSLALVADQTSAFIGLRSGAVAVIDLANGQTTDVLRGHLGEVYGVAISADGRIGVSGASDATVRLWNVTNPAEQARYSDHTARITGLAFAGTTARPDIITTSVDQTLRIRSFDSSGAPSESRAVQFDSQIRAMSLSPDDTIAYLGMATGNIQAVRLATGAVENVFPLHQSPVLALTVTRSGMLAATSAQGESLRIWDTATGTVQQSLDRYANTILDLSFSADGSLLAFAADDNALVIWNVADEIEALRFSGSQTPIASVAFSDDGTRLAAGARDGTIFVWNVQTGAVVYRVNGHTRDVWSLAFSSDGRSLVSVGGDGIVLWWDMTTGEEIERFVSVVAPALKIAVDPSQQYIATGADRGVVQVWRLYNGDALIDWTRANRYLRDLTCQERDLYRVQPLCIDEVQAPTQP